VVVVQVRLGQLYNKQQPPLQQQCFADAFLDDKLSNWSTCSTASPSSSRESDDATRWLQAFTEPCQVCVTLPVHIHTAPCHTNKPTTSTYSTIRRIQ
jgi:hypothetical protein